MSVTQTNAWMNGMQSYCVELVWALQNASLVPI